MLAHLDFHGPRSYCSASWLQGQAKRLAAEPSGLFDAQERIFECNAEGRVREWKSLRNGRLGFPVCFGEDGEVDCVSSVHEEV